ncbi:MAG: amino acid adenylation domain-containing protein, partial [Fibrobacterota bacterium]
MNVSFQQRQFYLLQNLDPESSAYNIPLVFTIDGSLDIKRFEHTVVTLFSSIDILKSCIKSSNGLLETIPVKDVLTNLHYSDMSSSTPEQIFEYLDRFITKPFTMTDILYRTVLIKQEQDSYIWCLVLQHSISDLKTKEKLCELIGELYNNPSTHIPETVSNYADYVKHQTSWLASDNAVSQKNYWQSVLDPVPKMLMLPVDIPRPSFLKFKGNVVYIEFDPDTTIQIKNCSAQNKVTPFLWLLTSYAIVLGKYANQDYFSIGVPFTNRRDDAFKETIGCFVNTLPVTIDLREPGTLLDLMGSIRKLMLLGHRNQEYPTELIIKNAVHKGSSLDANPVYQAGFTFEPFVKLTLNGCDVNQRYMHHGGSQLDLFATFWEENDCLSGVIEYNSTIYHEQTIERLAENFRHVVVQSLNNPQLNVHQADIVSRNERVLIDSFCKGREQLVSQDSDFVALFKKSVAAFKVKNAVTFLDKLVSYNELDKLSDKIAKRLLDSGIKANQFVGIFLDRSGVMLASIVGVLKAGAAYVPLDPQFPKDRIDFISTDASLAIILTEQKYYDSEVFKKELVINVDSIVNAPENCVFQAPSIQLTDAAYMIYTSGSTGKPKGVIITHGNLANFILSMLDDPGIREHDNILAITTISFDIHILELLVPLIAGSTIYIAPREAVSDPDSLIKLLSRNPITLMQATPTTWKMLNASGWKGHKGLTALTGGESLSKEVAGNLLSKCEKLYNMYGPTETTVWSTMTQITNKAPGITIGTPIANTSIRILDKWGKQVPIGCWGELLIGGDGVGIGYHNRPELNSERFIHLENTLICGKFYKTGDICRLLIDGNLECAGRVDNQVKIRGFRIELEEIENAIESISGVKNAAVIIRNEQNISILVAYINLKSSAELEIDAIRLLLQKRLPDYMIPSRFVFLESLPMTPNKKIDRNALQAFELPKNNSDKVTISTSTETENKITAIWVNKLFLSIRTPDDNFFDAGGNSLLILNYKDFLQAEFHCELSTTSLFQYTTIRSLAQYLNSSGKCETLQPKKDRVSLQKQ